MRSTLALLLAAACAADDPAPTSLALTVGNVATGDTWRTSGGDPVDLALAPGVWAITTAPDALLALGVAPSAALQTLAEVGDPTPTLDELVDDPAVAAFGTLSASDTVDYSAAPMLPGGEVTVLLPGDAEGRLVLLMMLGNSNDTVLASPDGGLAIDAAGDVSDALRWVDVGSEVDEPLGEGQWQPASASGVGEGPREDGVAHVVAPADAPSVTSVVSASLTAIPTE